MMFLLSLIGCQCDLGGADGVACNEVSGQCQCRKNVVGRKCTVWDMAVFIVIVHWNISYFFQCSPRLIFDSFDLNLYVYYCIRPAPSYYFPTLHQLKFEVEDGVTPNARPVRFGYNPQEFPDFSWRGYAVMSPAQVITYSHHITSLK